MSSDASPIARKPRHDPNSSTPRVDQAERHFYAAGAQPQGYVMSEVARQLELELSQALKLLRDKGIELPGQTSVEATPEASSAQAQSGV